MALIKCPECGREISDQSDHCIYCGFPLKNNNQLNKSIINQSSNDELPKSHVIGYRGEPGFIKWFSVVCLILGLVFIVVSFFLTKISIYIWPLSATIIGLCIYLIAYSIVCFARMVMNSNNKNNCIEYDANDRKLVLSTINGQEIRIDPKDYVELKDNFNTDNLLKFTYRLPSGQFVKANLGYCSNRNELRADINRIRDYFNYN